ncbi:F0F1 ATP synthase subunit A [Planotetraspora phitsanulokensis]|uniref:ATP synthase subunit a n=1 Tax=Planotetraspora phitsanulokensis TaxID=575192 RepID=A0A8J3XEB5_9ACTN|nr:F0F1 ATP synthase subunit A [Planotetraspora phitsanulokensis]GII38302.1 ATP synthase subunit a [Planotetraspora phitsanulokensis]
MGVSLVAVDEFEAPGVGIFDFPPLWDGAPHWLNKPVVMAAFGVVLVCSLAWAAFASPKLVPRGMQNAGEYVYEFVRDQVARPFLGKDAERWMPLLLSLFVLILVWNFMGVVPVLQFPVNSHIAFPVIFALVVYVLKIYLGIRHQGLGGYFKNMMFPPGLPKPLAIALFAPLELLYNFVTAPFTHAVRLFANMFAGHLLLAFFSAAGFWFLIAHPTLPGASIGVLSVVTTVAMTGLEIFIQFLQAFLFTMLAAMFIGGSLHPDH